MNREEVVALFRERLQETIEASGDSRAAFAERAGLDRSTLSQLLSPDNTRLPRSETVLNIARATQLSVDWLLGLSQTKQLAAEFVGDAPEIAPGGASPLDERLRRWHADATGYKIRYVPSTLPDLLKTEAVISYEFAGFGDRITDMQRDEAEARLEYSRKPETDIEAVSSFQSLDAFAKGEGIWRDLDKTARREQLKQIARLADELYPTFRWFLYDGLQRYSVPLTIFGPKRAAIYVGNMFFVFNATDQIRVLTRHFDDLIRAAVIQPTDVIGHIQGLLREHVAPARPRAAKEA